MTQFPCLPDYADLNKFRTVYGEWLNGCLWSDLHKEVFGFRPNANHHYPRPDKLEEALDILHSLHSMQIKMDKQASLMRQYEMEKQIARRMHRNGTTYAQELVEYARAQDHSGVHEDRYPNGINKIDEGSFLYEANLPFGLEDSIRWILRGCPE